MDKVTHVTVESAPTDMPPDCGHDDYMLSCPRCFVEMKALAKGNASVDTNSAIMQGAILLSWHVLMVLRNAQARLVPQMRSLDLHIAGHAKTVHLNFRALEDNLVLLVADPQRMEAALNQAAVMASEVQRMTQQKQAEQSPATHTAETSAIVLTDIK